MHPNAPPTVRNLITDTNGLLSRAGVRRFIAQSIGLLRHVARTLTETGVHTGVFEVVDLLTDDLNDFRGALERLRIEDWCQRDTESHWEDDKADPWTTTPCTCDGLERAADCVTCSSTRRQRRLDRVRELLSTCAHPEDDGVFGELPASRPGLRVVREDCRRCGATRITINGEPAGNPDFGQWKQPRLVRLLLAHLESNQTIGSPIFCRVCGCTDDERCWPSDEDLEALRPPVRHDNVIELSSRMTDSERSCAWVAPFLCSFCAAKLENGA